MTRRASIQLGLAAMMAAVVASGCRQGPENNATPGREAPASPWEAFVLDYRAKHPVKIGIPDSFAYLKRTPEQLAKAPPPDLDQHDPKYWRLSLGKLRIDPAYFKQRTFIFSRLNGPMGDFDLARKMTAEEILTGAMVKAWLKKHPETLDEAVLEAETQKAFERLKPEPYTTWREGAPFIGYDQPQKSKDGKRAEKDGLRVPMSPGITNPTLTMVKAVNPDVVPFGMAPPQVSGPRVLTLAAEKIDPKALKEVMDRGADVEIKGNVLYLRNRIFRSDEALLGYIREKQRVRLVQEQMNAETDRLKKKEKAP